MWNCAFLRWRQNLPQMLHRRNFVRLCTWLAYMLWLVVTPLRAQAPDTTLTLPQYRAELANAIQQLEAAPDDKVDETIQQLQKRFAAITHVTYEGDHTVTLTSILDDLSVAGADNATTPTPSTDTVTLILTPKEAALARLRGAAAQIDSSVNDNTTARLEILQEILARPEFNTPVSLWDRFWQWLRSLLSRWLPDSEPGSSSLLAGLVRAVPWVIAVGVVTVITWLMIYWMQQLLRSFVEDTRLDEADGEDDLPRSAAEARQQAHTAAQSGQYRDAVRRLYLAALLQLSELNLINYERNLTNREVLTNVDNNSPIRPHLEPVINTFDQVWYGVQEPDQTTFTAYEQEIDHLAAVATHAAMHPSGRGDT